MQRPSVANTEISPVALLVFAVANLASVAQQVTSAVLVARTAANWWSELSVLIFQKYIHGYMSNAVNKISY
jgi:hypothetical protein